MTDAAYEISFDTDRLDRDRIYVWLAEESDWAAGRPRDEVERSLQHSLVVGAYDGEVQLAVARAVTDEATFAWICDVYVDAAHRGRGIGTALVRALVERLEDLGLQRFLLATR